MRCSTTLITLTLLAALPGAAQADDHDDHDDNVTEYAFVDDMVHGDLANPNGEVLTVRRPGARPSLVRARVHYIPELLKSVEHL
jgi:hypothetical protein